MHSYGIAGPGTQLACKLPTTAHHLRSVHAPSEGSQRLAIRRCRGQGQQLAWQRHLGPTTPARPVSASEAPDANAAALSSLHADAAQTGAEAEPLPGEVEAAVTPTLGAVADVEELRGVRVNVDDVGAPLVEYLVHWKGSGHDTWEPVGNIAENLLRDYEDRWWKASREGDEEAIRTMLGGGRRVLSQSVDENCRSALHFAAATGNARILRILCEAGSEVNLQDNDGYTPLHMAAGYLHTPAVELLLHFGADPEVRDREGRSVLDLAKSLKSNLPHDAVVAQRRFALERCTEILTGTLYDELDPRQLLDVRKNEDGSRDFLVQWPDDSPDSWVNEANVAEDVVADFEVGLEYAPAASILRMVQRGDQRQYLLRWADSEHYPDSWEDEENVSPDLVAAWEREYGAKSLLHHNSAVPKRQQRHGHKQQRERGGEILPS